MDFEKMDVFRVAVEFRGVVERLLPKRGNVRDQLERAANSVVCNIAEGAGRRLPGEKAHFYGIARGSATECVGALAILRVTGNGDGELHREAYALLERIVMMTNRLIARFSGRASSASV